VAQKSATPFAAKAALIALSVIIATISVTSGVDKGIRVLSELNVALALGLILFVLFMGDTSFLLNALVLNVGDYVNRFMGMTLNSFAFDRPVEWMNNWTLFFWAWWVAWSPFVGLFLARISRGRTIRQFVMGTLNHRQKRRAARIVVIAQRLIDGQFNGSGLRPAAEGKHGSETGEAKHKNERGSWRNLPP
jgi:choline-glycine betaine transporter